MIGPGHHRARRAVLAVVVLAMTTPVAPGCGLGDKAAHADRIIAAVERARAEHGATGTVSVSMRIVELPIDASAIGALGLSGPDGTPAVDLTAMGFSPPLSAPVTLDLVHDRALIGGEDGGIGPMVFDDLALYGRRYDADDREARPWVTLDLRDLDEGDAGLHPTQDSPLLLLAAINPAVLLDLAAGPLTGSVGPGPTEDVAGVATVRYDANFDLDKTLRTTRRQDYDEDRREALTTALGVLGVSGRVHRGAVWLDDDGLPRRFQVALTLRPLRGFRLEVRLGLDLDDVGAQPAIDPPDPAELVAVDALITYLRSVVAPERAQLEGALTGMGAP